MVKHKHGNVIETPNMSNVNPTPKVVGKTQGEPFRMLKKARKSKRQTLEEHGHSDRKNEQDNKDDEDAMPVIH